MRAFEQAWELLKALPEQRMVNPLGRRQQQTVQPAIAGMLSRHLGMTPAAATRSLALEMPSVPRTYHTPFPPKDGKLVDGNYLDVPESELFPPYIVASDYRTRSIRGEPKLSQSLDREVGTPHEALREDREEEFRRRLEDHKSQPGYRGTTDVEFDPTVM